MMRLFAGRSAPEFSWQRRSTGDCWSHNPFHVTIRTKPFTIPRIVFARLTAEVYVRRFWYLLAPWPLLAIGMLVTNRDPRMIAMAIVIGLWPTTIPIRAYFFTSKAARLFHSPVWMSVEDGWIYFHGEDGDGLKLETSRISAAVELHGYFALVIGYMRLAFVPAEAFESAKGIEKFRRIANP